MAKRYSVLTYIINNYEVVHEVIEKDPEAEYLLITDDPTLKSSTWDVIYDKDLDGLSVFDKCYSIRFNCFKYCHTDICVRIDGSMGIKLSLKPLIDKFNDGNYDMGLIPHSIRHYIQDEYDVWVKTRGYSKEQANRCLNIMKNEGYDFSYKGLFQYGFVIERKSEKTIEIARKTYTLLKEMGTDGVIERLDQTVATFVINHYFPNLKVLLISSHILSSVFIQIYYHGDNSPYLGHMPDFRKKDIKYMFNKKVECHIFHTPLDQNIVAEREFELLSEIKKLQEEKALLNKANYVLNWKCEQIEARLPRNRIRNLLNNIRQKIITIF